MKLTDKEWRYLLILILLVILSRAFLLETHLHSYDSGNYYLAVQDYSIENTRPHLPGYFLYVKSAGVINALLGDIHISLLTLSVIFSMFSAFTGYLFFRKFFIPEVSFYSALALITNPVVWYYGIVTENYTVDLFFSSLIFLSGTSKRFYGMLPGAAAIYIGFRQPSAMLIFPLYAAMVIYQIGKLKISPKNLIIPHIGGLIILLSWLIPMLNNVGGVSNYLTLFDTQSPVYRSGVLQNIFVFSGYNVYSLLPLLIALPFMFNGKFLETVKKFYKLRKEQFYLLLLWFIPAMLFFIFSHYEKGYVLIIIPVIVFILGLLREDYTTLKKIIQIVIGIQIFIFLFLPYYAPEPDIYFNKEHKDYSIAELWTVRVLSSYEPTLNAVQISGKEIESILYLTGKYSFGDIFVDPSVSFYIRQLQVNMPFKYFYTMDLNTPEDYYLYHQEQIVNLFRLELYNLPDVLISRKSDFTDVIGIYVKEIEQKDGFVISRIKPGKRKQVYDLYKKFYLR